ANTVRHCLIADNEEAGIFYEISYGLYAQDNVIIGNGFGAGGGSWGAAAGIALSSSPDCIIERNLLIGNKEGFNFREQGRKTPRIGQPKGAPEVWVWNHDQIIRHNVIAYNRDAQTWGWFDVADERHWPQAMQVTGGKGEGQDKRPAADIAAEYKEKESAGLAGLSLEKLNITFANNLYARDEGQGLFNWGTSWRRHVYYDDLDAARRQLKLEEGSIIARFFFMDYLTRDFRVPPDSPALKIGAYPRGEVPGVQLGVLGVTSPEKAGRSTARPEDVHRVEPVIQTG
ncbi:MAG: right-handed parallel beta-helix repeat-containing protein, partial [Armatimonadota bacterium]|nr:right-handed parallel beta-helix repeat-containing protein [Armatimonadota bacterium]